MTENCTQGSNHWSHLIMKIDISCLRLLLMSLESGVSVTPLAAVPFRFCPAPNKRSNISKLLGPLQWQKVTQSQKILSFFFTPEHQFLSCWATFYSKSFKCFKNFNVQLREEKLSVCRPFIEIYTLVKSSLIHTLIIIEEKGKFLLFLDETKK